MGPTRTASLLSILVGVFLISARPSSPLHAQAGKMDAEEKRLRLQIQNLQRELRERELRIDQLQAQLKKSKTAPGDAKTRQLQQQLQEKDQRITKLEADLKNARPAVEAKKDQGKEVEDLRKQVKDLEPLKKAKHVHAVLLRRKEGTSEDQVKALLESAPRALGKIQGVRGLWVGTPVGGEAVKKDYDVGLILLFDDGAALRKFLEDPATKKFHEGLEKSWEKPVAYDFAP